MAVTSLRDLLKRVWDRLWVLGHGERALAWVAVESGGNPARLEPATTTWRAVGSLPVVLLTPHDEAGAMPVALSESSAIRVASLKTLPIGSRLRIAGSWWSVRERAQHGPGGALWVLRCVPTDGIDEGGGA